MEIHRRIKSIVVEEVVFQGVVYRRYPNARGASDRKYFVPSGIKRKAGMGRLHEEVWKAAHGPIPPGMHIHHVDGNADHNELENLQALSSEEHWRHHALRERSDAYKQRLAHRAALVIARG